MGGEDMILLKLVLFIGMFLGTTYGIEYLLPPFGQLFYTDPVSILLSLSKSISYGTGIPEKYSLGFTILLVGILPLFIVIQLGKKLKRKQKKNIKYRFK